tara:strand:- start:169 stop:393 length:225 start_codon:yes stop_codon:yes gene_type:complete
MTNKHIELVKKWLADNDSVSLEELDENDNAASAAAADSVPAYAAYAAYVAANDPTAANAPDPSYWVERYEEMTK